MRVRGRFVIATLVCLLAAGSLMAQTTKGGIQGAIVDEGNQALPGVTIVLSSEALMGTNTAVSDANGKFRFILLPPGTYKSVFTLPGYQTVEQENITIGVAQTITLDVEMRSAFTEEVLVTSEAPVVDVTSTTVGANLGQELIVDLPTGRNFAALTFLAAGATTGGQGMNVNIMGATGSENRYVVDELDTTDPAYGTIGTNISFNFIQEVQVQTGGYEAEYGGALGGVINMITKSGSNEFHGEVFGYYTGDSFSTEAKVSESTAAARTSFTDYDIGFDVGGRIIRDKLWYFVALNPNYLENKWVNTVYRLDGTLKQTNIHLPETEAMYYAGKLTWQITSGNSLTATVIGDPTTITDDFNTSNYIDTPYMPTDMTYGDREQGGTNYNVTFSSILNEDMIFEAKYGRHESEDSYLANSDIPWYEDGSTSGVWSDGVGHRVRFGGPSFQQPKDERSRDQLRGAFTWFLGDSHEIKVGVQWNWVEYEANYQVAGSSAAFCAPIEPWAYAYLWQVGDYVDMTQENEDILAQYGNVHFCDPGNGDAYGGVEMPDRVGNRLRMRNSYWYNSNYKQNSVGQTDESAIYLQDDWKLTDYMTLKLGVRADSSKISGDASKLGLDNRSIELEWKDTIQPRLGFIWDYAHNGRSKLYAHYGRFYESIPLDINVRAFGNENYDFYFYMYPDSGLPTVNNPTLGLPNNTGNLWYLLRSGGGTAADPNLGGQYMEEWVVGTEYEVMTNMAVGFKGIYRRLGRVIEDISVDGGNSYFITNPGGWYYENPVTGIPLDEPAYFPKPSRIYRGLELSMNKRFSDNWQLYASLLWSMNKGNYGGLFRADNGQQDPNITSLYDLPDLLEGAEGLLPNDHEWQFKTFGSYRFDFGLVAGGTFTWMTGAPITQFGAHSTYGPNERFVTPRGSYGRTPTLMGLDAHLAYPIKIGDFDLEFILDIFNVFNEQKAITVDQEWSIYDENEAADMTVEEQKTNDLFGAGQIYQAPRNYRLGIKFSF